jgi:hypothetical protein
MAVNSYNKREELDWDKWEIQIDKQAKDFVESEELDQLWYLGGDIVSSAIICGVWGGNIHKVCNWVVINGRGMQPELAQQLIDINT